ncbi:MAG: hypothetical protein QM817_32405 [Archangium sp.]
MNESCFLCGAPALRREMITTGRQSIHHTHTRNSHVDSATTRELKPLCAGCIAEQEAQAKLALKVAGTGLAIGGGFFALTFLLPFLFCLGSAAVLGALAWFAEHR